MTRSLKITAVAVATCVTLGLAACGSDQDSSSRDNGSTTASTTVAAETPTDAENYQVGQRAKEVDTTYTDIDPAVFSRWDAMAGTGGQTDPEWVMKAGLAETFAWKPHEDHSAFDAVLRADSIWNRQYVRDNEAMFTTSVPMSMRTWMDWDERGIEFFPRVSVLPDEHPQDTKTDVQRVVKIDMLGGDPAMDRAADDKKMSIIAHVRVHNAARDGEAQWRLDNIGIMQTIVD